MIIVGVGVITLVASVVLVIVRFERTEVERQLQQLSHNEMTSLHALILNVMAKRPEDRYQTAAEFAEALRDALSGKSAANEDATVIAGASGEATAVFAPQDPTVAYQTAGTSRGAPAAVRLARERHPDIVVLDLNLPRLDGYGVLSHLRARPATALDSTSTR